MSKEIQVSYTTNETNMYFTIHRESDGYVLDVLDVSDNAFESFASASLNNYKNTLTEEGDSGLYIGDVPSKLTNDGKYTIKAWTNANANIGSEYLYWNGSAEIGQTEYDLRYGGSTDEPDGVATNLWDRMTQVWMRFFNKVEKNSTTITVYNASNVAETEQTYTEGETTDVVNQASSV